MKINEATKKYPQEITGSGYSIRDGATNGWSNSYQLTGKKLKDDSIKWNSVYNYSKSAGTPWIRCLNLSDAQKLCDALKDRYPDLNPVKNGSEQVLRLIGFVDDVPVYACTGHYYETKYYLDKDTGKVISAEANQNKYLDTLKKPANLAKAVYQELSANTYKYFSITNDYLKQQDFKLTTYVKKDTTYGIRVDYNIEGIIKDSNEGHELRDALEKEDTLGYAYYRTESGEFRVNPISRYYGSYYDMESDVKDYLNNHSGNITTDDVKKLAEVVAKNTYISHHISEKEDRIASLMNDIKSEVVIEDYKWVFDTILVYVANIYGGGGWDTEIPVVNNNISDSIKAYKKQLGPGYWIEYLKPGKMHYNKELKEDMDSIPCIYDSNNIKAYILPDDNQKVMEFLKQFNMNAEFNLEPEFYYIFVDAGKDQGYVIEVHKVENILSEIALAFPDSYTSPEFSLTTLLLLEPALYKILDKQNISIPGYNYSNQSSFELATNFRNKFKGTDYDEAKWLLQKSIELGKEEDPWGFDPEVEDSIVNQLINDPVSFVEGLDWDIRQLNRDGQDELAQLAINIKEKAERLLFPDTFIEKLN